MRFRSFRLRIERTPKTAILPESPIGKKARSDQFGWGFQGLPDATQSAATPPFIQWLSSALGGYLTGRLRTRWAGILSDEAFLHSLACRSSEFG
jgi:hypothetical protein